MGAKKQMGDPGVKKRKAEQGSGPILSLQNQVWEGAPKIDPQHNFEDGG